MLAHSRLGLLLVISLFCARHAIAQAQPQDPPPLAAPGSEEEQKPTVQKEKELNDILETGLTNQQSYYANAHPYFEEPLAQLVARIPSLATLQPSSDQSQLALILQKVGSRMDDFGRDIGDLIAREEVIHEQLNEKGKVKSKDRVFDSYLILQHGHVWGANAEYRMDEKGNKWGFTPLHSTYLVTSGFALSGISFSSANQFQSRFRYLGEQKVDGRQAYVVGYAQQPGKATFTTVVSRPGDSVVEMLTQGILWIDEDNFQIIQMRTDLLAPRVEINLNRETTEIKFGETHLPDTPDPLWLPTIVNVYLEINNDRFRNEHHYTDYRRYRVSVKINGQ